ncbi:MAG TPA: nucleoside-diphosphate sugar epimerase/dehydratase [Bacteroidales bacterium]|nr:nucleoside-diphosphate sugar epimerase/dehydratase [Bacteroidales bacterium]
MIQTLKDRILEVFKNHSLPRWMVLLIDMSVVYFSFLIAYMLRFNFENYMFELSTVFRQALIVLVVYAFFMLVFKSYHGMIRHTTINDTYKIILSDFSAVIILILITLLSRKNEWQQLFNIPLSILIIHNGAVVFFMFLFRVFVKIFYQFASSTSQGKKNVIIYGSGDMGMTVRRVIDGDPKGLYRIKCFIDDDKKLQGKKVNGYPVFSRKILTKEFIVKEDIKAFIISINKIAPSRKREVIESVIDLGCEILETPSLDTWLNGQLEVKNIKKVKFEDLLGRDPIKLDLKRIQEGLRGKVILVTGAAGSIGSEIVRQLMKFEYKRLILVDQAETPSFFLNIELQERYPDANFKIIIGDITNELKMEFVFRRYHPEIIFHAAAYKHVPVMEANPHESFRINVGGTKVVSDLAIKYNAEKFVMVSSDKAVNPTNVMGATKKVCELLVHAQAIKSDIKTKFITTRFGNVLGSNGSVIPLFKNQIADGGPITITHPDISRYFMTIPEACQLVLEAGFMGKGGEIFIFDMGNPIKIMDIAIKLIQLSGLVPYEDIDIKVIGLRPGEKLYEELFADSEQQLLTHNPKISIAKVADADFACIIPMINDTLADIYNKTGTEVIESMMDIVPGYVSDYSALHNVH